MSSRASIIFHNFVIDIVQAYCGITPDPFVARRQTPQAKEGYFLCQATGLAHTAPANVPPVPDAYGCSIGAKPPSLPGAGFLFLARIFSGLKHLKKVIEKPGNRAEVGCRTGTGICLGNFHRLGQTFKAVRLLRVFQGPYKSFSNISFHNALLDCCAAWWSFSGSIQILS
jgi:hypothetical protein